MKITMPRVVTMSILPSVMNCGSTTLPAIATGSRHMPMTCSARPSRYTIPTSTGSCPRSLSALTSGSSTIGSSQQCEPGSGLWIVVFILASLSQVRRVFREEGEKGRGGERETKPEAQARGHIPEYLPLAGTSSPGTMSKQHSPSPFSASFLRALRNVRHVGCNKSWSALRFVLCLTTRFAQVQQP